MKYCNLVFCCQHEGDKKAYVYMLPLDKEVERGWKLWVHDAQGYHAVIADSDNMLCGEKSAKAICRAMGGYFPPAPVIGTVTTDYVPKERVNYFEKRVVMDCPPEGVKEDFPWM